MKRRTFLTRVASALGIATVGTNAASATTRNSYKPMTLADIPKDDESYYDLSIAAVFSSEKSLKYPAGYEYVDNKLFTHYGIDSEVYLMRRISGWRFDSLRSLRKPIGSSSESPQCLLERAINTEGLTVYKFSTLPEFLDFASNQLKRNPVK